MFNFWKFSRCCCCQQYTLYYILPIYIILLSPGRAMETIDRGRMSLALYPTLSALSSTGELTPPMVENVLATSAGQKWKKEKPPVHSKPLCFICMRHDILPRQAQDKRKESSIKRVWGGRCVSHRGLSLPHKSRLRPANRGLGTGQPER